MIKLKEGAGIVVAGDVRNAVAAVDDALLNGAKLCVSVLEAAQGTNLPVQQTQKLYRSITTGLSAVLDGRGEFVAAVRQMNEIKARSNLAPQNYGCPDGWDAVTAPLVGAESRQEETA